MIVLDIVKGKVERHADQGHALARQAIELGVLKRKVVKQTVMTICYGVTSLGSRLVAFGRGCIATTSRCSRPGEKAVGGFGRGHSRLGGADANGQVFESTGLDVY